MLQLRGFSGAPDESAIQTAAGENKFPHILNGSGTALARLFVALVETYQQADGSVSARGVAALDENRPDRPGAVMKILLASSEVLPYSKTGGLADMVGALAKFLAPRRPPGRGGHAALSRACASVLPALQPLDWKLDLPLGAGAGRGPKSGPWSRRRD